MDQPEHTHQSRVTLERMIQIMTDADYDKLHEVMHPDFVQEIPQSGERVVGIENFVNILGGMARGDAHLKLDRDVHIQGDEDRYVMTPTFSIVRIEGVGDELTSYIKARYPDGSDWYIVTFSTFRDGKVVKRVDFFAPMFEPPKWRAQWVEVA